MTTFFFLVRLSLTAALIYAAVWLESKAALTLLLVLLVAASEIAAFKFQQLASAIAATLGGAAARIKARQAHRRVHGKR